jgi:hypothetical protein
VSATSAEPARAGDDRRRRLACTPARIVMGVGLLAIAVAAIAILAQRQQRRSGTNGAADFGYVIAIHAGEQVCEPGELLPGDTGALRLRASSGGTLGPEVGATVADGHGRTVATGVLRPGWRTGMVTIATTRVAQTMPAAIVCLVNRGSQAIAFGGSVPDADFYVVLGGKPLNGRMRIEYMRPGRESWFSLAPTLVHRFSLAKADLVRHWAAAAALVLMLIAIVLATRIVLHEEST